MQQVAHLIARTLTSMGVEHVFGIPGKSIVPLVVALGDNGIKFILTRHENGAGFAAGGYALTRDSLGVAISTSGPGATNLITSAGQAAAYNLPVLFITGQTPIKETGKPLSQDSGPFGLHIDQMFAQVVKFSGRIERADQVERYLTTAINKAFDGIPGPVHLSIPHDVFLDSTEEFTFNFSQRTTIADNLADVVERLVKAESPLIVLGEGVKQANITGELLSFIEKFELPVVSVPGGKGFLPDKHPLNYGIYGLGGHDSALEMMNKYHDLVLVIGTRLEDMAIPFYNPNKLPKHVIHFTDDIKYLRSVIDVPTTVVGGSLTGNFTALGKLLGLSTDIPKYHYNFDPVIASKSTLLSAEVCQQLSYLLGYETTVFSDVGNHGYYAIRHLQLNRPNSFIFDDYFACMGHGIGYAMGAKVAAPNREVVCLTGDGCFYMHGAEISTAVANNLNLTFIVFNNAQLDMVYKGMKNTTGRTDGTAFGASFNIAQFSSALGALSFRCQNLIEFTEAFLEKVKGVKVIEVLVASDETSPTGARK